MQIKKTLSELERSSVFKAWKKSHSKAYLAHFFKLVEEKDKDFWQIGYYVPNHDKVATFFMKEKIEVSEESEIFKKDKHKIAPLDISKIKIDFKLAMGKADKIRKQKYPKEKPIKSFLILQHLEQGQLWNITYLTSSFNTVNIKLDAATAKLISHEVVNFIQWKNK